MYSEFSSGSFESVECDRLGLLVHHSQLIKSRFGEESLLKSILLSVNDQYLHLHSAEVCRNLLMFSQLTLLVWVQSRTLASAVLFLKNFG